jgi:hypothetical protein
MKYGCLPKNEQSEATVAAMKATAVPLNQIYESGEMPVIQWDGNLTAWLAHRESVLADLNRDNKTGYALPWNTAKRHGRNTDQLYFSQGNVGSCCGHAFGFAYSSSILTNIALGGSQHYEAINPIGTYVLSHGGRMFDGQTVGTMAKWCNRDGNFLVKDIGADNQRVPAYSAEAKQHASEHQSAIIFLDGTKDDIAEKIMQCLRGGVAVAMGNSTAVNGSTLDENGMVVATFGGSWSHATHFAAWMRVNGVDYYAWINSHGKRYRIGKCGETGDGCWMTANQLRRFTATASNYGDPCAVLAEGKAL